MIRFNANLYRIAMLCSSTEATRYYLAGAYIEPHAIKGVTLTATDGHKLVTVYDENGFADESAIIKLTPDAMKACKPGRYERRDVVIASESHDATANVTVVVPDRDENTNALLGTETLEDTPVAFSKGCKIDGTFPDYRRVFPSEVKPLDAMASPSFSTLVTATMTSIANELSAHYTKSKGGVARYNSVSAGGPSLVTFPPAFNAVAVAMPMRSICEAARPSWFDAKPAAPSLAPAATAALETESVLS